MQQPSILKAIASLLIAATLLIPAAEAFANDSIARVGAGGITFLKSKDVRLLEEILWISHDMVRVRYRFLNESHRNIRATVAFPLPVRRTPDYPVEQIHANQLLRKSFTVRVNGRLVPTEFIQRAMQSDRNITHRLRKVGLSDEQIFRGAALKLDQQVALKKRGLVPWEIAVALYWRQNFPAGKTVAVEHAYVPYAGGRYQLRYQTESYDPGVLELYPRQDGDRKCFRDANKRDMEQRIKAYAAKGAEIVHVTERDVEYILSTGQNWKGSIRRFTLRIEKDSPHQFVSVCFPGKPKRVSPTVYEYVRENFVPKQDLVVHFYSIATRIHK